MPNRNALLGLVEFIGEPGAPFDPANSDTGAPLDPADTRAPIRIGTTTDWRMAYLDPQDERYEFWRSMLAGLQEDNTPVFVEVEPATRALTTLRLPIITRVLSVTRVEAGAWVVYLDRSATRHMTYEDDGDPEAMARLKELQRLAGTDEDVMVTVDRERNRIIDVAPLPPTVTVDRGEPFAVLDRSLTPLIGVVSEINPGDLAGFYANLRVRKCNLSAMSDTCLAVQFADDHCIGVAEHMCLELAKPPLSLEAGKVWLHSRPTDDGLEMPSQNAPQCSFEWRFHVAAFVFMRGSHRRLEDAVLVIDPAACLSGPLTLLQWQQRVSGREEILDFTLRKVFDQASPGNFTLKPRPTSEISHLNKMRCQLKVRLDTHHGAAPPFANCPVDQPCP